MIAPHVHGVAGERTVERLIAPNLSSRSRVMLGGHGFGTRTTSGVLPTPNLEDVVAVRGARVVQNSGSICEKSGDKSKLTSPSPPQSPANEQ